MTVTLTQDTANAKVTVGVTGYDAVLLERSANQVQWTTVRGAVALLGAAKRLVFDAFGRVTASGWGTTDSGHPWAVDGTAAQYSTNGTVGVQAINALNTTFRSRITGLSLTDAGMRFSFLPPAAATGNYIRVEPVVRFIDALNFYSARYHILPSNAIDLQLVKLAGGAETVLASIATGVTFVPGTRLRFDVQMVGQVLRSKVWVDGTAEPSTWKLTAKDGTHAAGSLALTSLLPTGNTNTLPFNVTFDDLEAGPFVAEVDDYEFTPGVTNYYRASAAPKGLWLPGVSGNYASTPDTAALDITSDIDLRADLTLPTWPPAATMALVSKWGAAPQRSYLFNLTNTGTLQLAWSDNGSASIARSSTVAVPITTGRLAVRVTLDVDNGAAGHTATFYTGPSIDGPWTQLGAPVVTAGTTSIFSGTLPVEVGSHTGGTSSLGAGVTHRAQIRAGINGTLVASPIFETLNDGTTSFADGAGRTWTVNGAGQVLTVQPVATVVPVLDRVWLKSLVRPFLNRPVTVVGFSDPTRPGRSTENEVTSRTLPVATNDVRSSRRWAVDLYVANAADAQTLDYILAAGDVMLLHTPRGSDVPGGYVQIKDYGQRHPEGRRRGDSRIFTLPAVEAAPPGPDVAATIGTWASVLAAYPTWDAVLAAFPTWADLLALHGDPSEVIVP